MNSKKFSFVILNISVALTILNTWLWNPQLPFINYAANDTKMVIIQVVHVLLNIATTFLLLKIGQAFAQKRSRFIRLVNSWVLVIGVGLGEIIINLLWKQQFSFSDLINSLFPLTRNVIPLVMAVILGGYLVPQITKLGRHSRYQIAFLIVLALGADTLFNANIWGGTNTYNLLLTFVILVLGGCLYDFQFTGRISKQKIIIGILTVLNILLAGIMPKISLSYNDSFTSAARFSNPNNVLTILIAIGCFILIKDKLNVNNYYFLLLSLLFGIYPIMVNHFVGALRGHFGSGIVRYSFMVVAVIILLGISFGCAILVQRIAKTDRYKRYADHIESLQEPGGLVKGTKLIWKKYQHDLVALVVIYIVAICSFFAMNNSFQITPNVDRTYNVLIYTFCNRQSLVLLTTVLIWLMFKFFQALTNRFWWGIGITLILNVIWIIANRIKIDARDEPILPSEIVMYQAYSSMIKMVSPILLGCAFLAIIVCCGVIILLNRKYNYSRLRWSRRLIYVVVTILVYGSCFFWNHEGTPIQSFMAGMNDQPMPFNQLSGARLNGPLIQFMNNVDIKVMDRPSGYSKLTMQKIAKRYRISAQTINQTRSNDLDKQTIILNLSESYSNPERVPGVKLRADPMSFVKSMKKSTTSGLMISSGYGGGTANMEYMSLTGLVLANFSPTLVTPFTQLVPFSDHPWSINQLFHQSSVIHPYVGTFYSRTTVYKKFGIDRFIYLGSKYPIRHQKRIDRSPYLSDYTAYANAIDRLNEYKRPQFISLVTMQNHFPYTEHFYNGSSKYKASIKGATTDPETVAQYAMGLHYTDLAVKNFIQKIDKMQQPITVVFYGDHLPGIYENDMSKDGLKLHETDYFIYSNPAARRAGAKQTISSDKLVGPNDFIPMIAQQTNSKVTPYLALLTMVHKKLPAVSLKTNTSATNEYHSSPQFVNENGKIVSYRHFTKKQKQLWKDYVMVQYDMTSGHHYLERSFFQKSK